ncbi:MAG: non-hydrolyzing UDP-N-acetylglucosamine 2-epimerase [Blastocatellia bacterium]
MRVVLVAGARPNFIKVAPILRAMARQRDDFDPCLVHTGQHYDREMAGIFFEDLKLPRPDIELGIGQGSPTEQVARIMLGLEPILTSRQPDWVLVVGDVNSTLGASLAAAKGKVPLAHVEAGLRSFDRRMPEETNRVVVDQLADLLLTPSPDANENLHREGIPEERIFEVGNVMIDSLRTVLEEAPPRRGEGRTLASHLQNGGPYGVVTLHRAANVDDAARLTSLLGALGEIARRLPLFFPIHPRTAARLAKSGLTLPAGIEALPPLGYRDFLDLWSKAALVLTDSGGLQEETTALGVPCLTLRETTERPITVECGTNHLVGVDPDRILVAARQVLAAGMSPNSTRQLVVSERLPLWDGHASERILSALLDRSSR